MPSGRSGEEPLACCGPPRWRRLPGAWMPMWRGSATGRTIRAMSSASSRTGAGRPGRGVAVHDSGFSESGDDALRRWGEERIVERLVRAYRQSRPDIVIPTFLDVPGQHGHHRAMTRAAETALDLAADASAFPEHAGVGLRPWQVSKFYLPAWSGAGYASDDEAPPPPAPPGLPPP